MALTLVSSVTQGREGLGKLLAYFACGIAWGKNRPGVVWQRAGRNREGGRRPPAILPYAQLLSDLLSY